MDKRQDIIANLYESQDMKNALAKMNPPELREDLKQELFLVLCEMNSEKLFELYNRNELRFYAVRIMLNQIQSKTSPFYYKFRKHLEHFIEYKGQTEVPDEPVCEASFEILHTACVTQLGELTWYEQDLFRLYIEKNRNASVIARETSIPIRSIYHTLKLIKEKVKENIK